MERLIKTLDKAIADINESKESLLSNSLENKSINIIIDTSEQPGLFIEIENNNGFSIDIGKNSTTKEGYRKLRITASDIINHNKI